MALGVALIVAVLVAQKVIRDSFTRGASGYHLVVGKKGSQLQLVLNTVYHLQDPIENIPYSYYKRLITPSDDLGKNVKVAIPYCLGDNYEGFRVVGTIPDLFTKLEYADGKKYEFEEGGRNFRLKNYFEAVIGSTVAREAKLKVGDEFQPVHGLSDEGDGHKHDAFKIVGVLKPTGTANDRALFINIEGFYLLENHAKPLDEVAAAKPAAKPPADDHDHAHDHAHDKDADHDHADHKDPAHDHADHDHAKPEEAGHKDGEAAHDHEGEAQPAGGAKASAEGKAAPDEHADHDHAKHDEAEHEKAADKPPADHDHDEHAGHDHPPGEAHDHADHDHDHAEKGATDKAPADKAHDHDAHAGHDHADHDHDAHDDAGHDHADHDHAGHDHSGHSHSHEPLPEDQREVTAVLVLAKGDLYASNLRTKINEGEQAQAAAPIRVIADFFQKIVNSITVALLSLTALIIVISGIGIMVSIYNSMNDRRRDIAVMRALGASRGTVLAVILVESILLSLAGGVVGVLLGHTLVAILGPIVEGQTGVSLGFFQFDKYELVLIPGLVALASLMGYLPALSAYRTDVAKALSASP